MARALPGEGPNVSVDRRLSEAVPPLVWLGRRKFNPTRYSGPGVRLSAAGVEPATLEEIAHWGVKHCPVCDALERAVPVTTHVSTS